MAKVILHSPHHRPCGSDVEILLPSSSFASSPLPSKEGADIQIQKYLILNVKPAHHSGFVLQIFRSTPLVFCLPADSPESDLPSSDFSFVFGVKMNNIFPRDHSARTSFGNTLMIPALALIHSLIPSFTRSAIFPFFLKMPQRHRRKADVAVSPLISKWIGLFSGISFSRSGSAPAQCRQNKGTHLLHTGTEDPACPPF